MPDADCTICKGSGYTTSYHSGLGTINRCRCNRVDFSRQAQIAWGLRYIKEKYSPRNAWRAWSKKEELMADKVTDYFEQLAKALQGVHPLRSGRYSVMVDRFGVVHVEPSYEAELESAVCENSLLMVERAQRVTELEEANAQLCAQARETQEAIRRVERLVERAVKAWTHWIDTRSEEWANAPDDPHEDAVDDAIGDLGRAVIPELYK